MFLNHKTLFVRPRNPTARAKLLFAVTNPEINLWASLVALYKFTHPADDQDPAPFPSLELPKSKMTPTDWKRFVEVILRDNKTDQWFCGQESLDWFYGPHSSDRSFDQEVPVAADPAAQVVWPPIHQPMLKQEPPVEASPATRKRRPVDVPVQQPSGGGGSSSSKRVNQLLRPRSL
jgi:hypothetical protein